MIHSDVVIRGHFFLKLSINADGVKQTLRDNAFIELVMECHYLYISIKKSFNKWICTCSGVDKKEINILKIFWCTLYVMK